MVYLEKVRYDLIHAIMKITDVSKLEKMYALAEVPRKQGTHPFEKGVTVIRSNLTADDLFAEQGNKSITFAEITEITKDIEWEHSLADMLAALD